jgi:hypothetical protein
MSSKMRNYPPFGGKKVHFFKFVAGKGIQFSFSLLSEDRFFHGPFGLIAADSQQVLSRFSVAMLFFCVLFPCRLSISLDNELLRFFFAHSIDKSIYQGEYDGWRIYAYYSCAGGG